MEALIPQSTVWQILSAVPPVAVCLGFAYLIIRNQRQASESAMKEQRAVTDRQNQLIDTWWERHETAEEKQFKVIEKLGSQIDDSREKIQENTAVLRDLHHLIASQNDTYTTLAHETKTMSQEIHIGLPGYTGGKLPFDAIVTKEYLSHIASDGRPWSHQPLGIPALYAAGVRGQGAVVAVIDTGVQPDHPDLAANLDMGRSRDFTRSGINDRNSHGTHCAGIVACDDQGVGLMGVAPDAKVITYKALSDSGSGGANELAGAIVAGADDPTVDVISMSFGAGGEIPQITQAIRYAASKNKILVAAAGNSGPNSINWPGALPEVICVGAVAETLRVDTYSSTNDFVDCAAPGTRILSTIPGGRYASLSGTSMACPFVAAVFALGVSECRKKGLPHPTRVSDLNAILERTCRDISVPGKDPNAGYGLIQPKACVDAFVAWGEANRPTPPQPEQPQPEQPKKVFKINVPKDAEVIEITRV